MTERDRAPGRLLLLQEFVNSLEVDTGLDQLADASGAVAWLAGVGLLAPGAETNEAEVSLARSVREGLRELLWANNGAPVSQARIRDLNRLAAGLPVTVDFTGTGASNLVAVASGVVGSLATLVGIAHTAMADGTWDRLKACREDTCKWVYYDHSRNRSSAWCSMAVCGNRAKARAFRARSKSPD